MMAGNAKKAVRGGPELWGGGGLWLLVGADPSALLKWLTNWMEKST